MLFYYIVLFQNHCSSYVLISFSHSLSTSYTPCRLNLENPIIHYSNDGFVP
uniref:Uncharacterized protein n=1 Tax=Arundo donax TaxID=35708 RepID=A0A0A8YX96_ARUDO